MIPLAASAIDQLIPRVRGFAWRSVTNGLGGSFIVQGGPLAGVTTMGWHVTDDGGFTVAVSCDHDFLLRVRLAMEIAQQLVTARERDPDAFENPATDECRFCRGVNLHHGSCALVLAQALIRGR